MVDRISELPDDILSHIISLLTERESVRARCLSHRWKNVVDCRTVVQFKSETVLGKHQWSCQKFVTAVDQFLNTWESQTISEFHLEFHLTNQFAPYLDRWIATAAHKGVETLDLDLFSGCGWGNRYTLPCHRWHSSLSSLALKHLRLKFCNISVCTGCNSWLSSLTTLELNVVILDETDIKHILSSAVNLTSLTLDMCVVTHHQQFNVHLPHLKNLIIKYSRITVDLNCPNLESLAYDTKCCISFSCHPPFLRRASLALIGRGRLGCSCEEVDRLTTIAPMLQHLYLSVMSEIPPQLPSISMHSLKSLHLRLKVPINFNLFTVTDILHLSPSLETFHLEVNYYSDFTRYTKERYPDRPLRCLKEFKFERYSQVWQEMDFAQYLLRNAVALEKMIIIAKYKTQWTVEPKFNLLQGIHPSAELIILGDILCAS